MGLLGGMRVQHKGTIGWKWGLPRVGGGSGGVPEDMDLLLGTTSGLSSGVEGPLRDPPCKCREQWGCRENSEDAGARIQGQSRWHRALSAHSCTWSLPILGAQRTGQLPMAGGPPLQFGPGLCGAGCYTIIDYCLRTRSPQKSATVLFHS